MKQIPAAVRTDPGWRGAMFILQTAFAEYGDSVWAHVDTEKCSIFFAAMIEGRAWSSTEELMLKAAASLFDPDFQIPLYRLVNRLDDHQFLIVMAAMSRAAGRSYSL